MTLSPKAIRFVLEALDYYLQDRDQQLRQSTASDDELADWENDRQFLEAIKQDCLEHLAQPLEAAHVEV